MKNRFRKMMCAALAALLLLGLFPIRAAADSQSLSVSVNTEDGPAQLNLKKDGGIWYADVESLAGMAHCETNRNASSGILSVYRPESAAILYLARDGEYLAVDDGFYVPFEACAFSLGLRFTRYVTKDGFYVTAMKTPKDLEKLLNQIFTRKNYQLWEVPAEGGWEWIATETASRIWAMLPFVGNTSILDTATGMAEKERYDRALASIMASSGDFLDLVYSSSDMDQSLKKAGKILASSEKEIDALWSMIEDDSELCKKLTDAGIFETVRSMFETGSNPYENAPEDFLRDYPTVANAFNVSYWLDRFAFYGVAVDGDEAAVLAMKKALGASSNSYIRDSATRLYESQYGNQAALLEDIYSGYLYHFLSDSLSDAVKKGLYGDSSLMGAVFAKAIEHGIELYFDSPSISGISDATIYYSIYSSYAIELSDYYFRHRDDTENHTAMDLRAVGILYLNTAKACVEKCKFDESLSETTAAMDELIAADLKGLLDFGDQEYEPSFDNLEFVQWLDGNDSSAGKPLPDDLPVDLFETSWWYSKGQSMGGQYALLFHVDGHISVYHLGSGSFVEDMYFSWSDNKLILTSSGGYSIPFVWIDGEFRSEQQYEMQVGSDYYFITKDPQQMEHFQSEPETAPSNQLPWDITGHWNGYNTNWGTGWYELDLTIYSADKESVNADWVYRRNQETLSRGSADIWVNRYVEGENGFLEVCFRYDNSALGSYLTVYFYPDGTAEVEFLFVGTSSLTRTENSPEQAPPETEPPTDPPETERPTEPPSLARRCEPYLSLLREYLSYGEAIFYLVEIDSDDIPELVISPAQIHTAKPEVYTIRNGELVYVGTFDGEYGTGLMFGQNRIISFHDDYENVYCVYDYYEGEATLLKSFSEGPRVFYTYEPEIVYRVDGQEVSAEEYRNSLLSWVDESDTFRYWPTFAVTEENIESFAADPYMFYPDCSNFRSGYIYLEPEELYFDAPDQTAQLDMICDPHSAAGYYLESSDYNVVTFDISGLVTAVGPGWAEITISMNGFTSTCRVYCNWEP